MSFPEARIVGGPLDGRTAPRRGLAIEHMVYGVGVWPQGLNRWELDELHGEFVWRYVGLKRTERGRVTPRKWALRGCGS